MDNIRVRLNKTKMKKKFAVFVNVIILWALGNICLGAPNKLLFLSSQGAAFEQVIHAIKSDLDEEFQFTVINAETTSEAQLKIALDTIAPHLIVLLGNTSITLYKNFLISLEGQTQAIPSIALLALQIDQHTRALKNSTGILYEVPLVISAVKLRTLSQKPTIKLGVVHRQIMTDHVAINTDFVRKEGFELIAESIPNNASLADVSDALKRLRRKHIDALWILNDSHLLSARMIRTVWLKQLARIRAPVIVGTPNLVNTKLPMGMLSVYPDLDALGLQAANFIVSIQAQSWRADNAPVQQPLSVVTKFNLDLARQWRIPVNEPVLLELDELLY